MMILVAAAMLVGSQSADAASIQAEKWARKAKPIVACETAAACDVKWERGKEWIRANSRFAIAVDKPSVFATHGAIYANTDLSYVIERRQLPGGKSVIAARAWCGNVIRCSPSPKDAVAALTRELQ